MIAFPITDSDRSRWQRRAAAELVGVLGAHPNLPVIAWTIGSAGSALVGHINGLAPAAQVSSCFQVWRRALGLRELTPATTADGEITYLSASITRNRVKVQLIATVIEGGDSR